MFFATDAAFVYFSELVTKNKLWNEIDAIIIDIMMPEGTLLPKEFKHEKIDGDNAGEYLKRYLSKLVTEYRIPQNPGTILPVMVLTNKQLGTANGMQRQPQPGDQNRLWVWNMEKTFALNNLDSLISNLNRIVAGRVK